VRCGVAKAGAGAVSLAAGMRCKQQQQQQQLWNGGTLGGLCVQARTASALLCWV
jgi:hypothetical protein